MNFTMAAILSGKKDWTRVIVYSSQSMRFDDELKVR